MGILSRIFSRKKKEELKVEVVPKMEITPEIANMENVRAKMDLLLTQLESLKIQNDVLNEKIGRIERTLNEVYSIAKRS